MVDHAHVVEVTNDYLIVTFRNILVTIWKQETTLDGVSRIRETRNALADRFPSNVLLLTVVEEGAPMPPPAERDALADFLKGSARKVARSAVVNEGAGFRAAAIRSIVTGLTMLTKLPFSHETFATVDEAVRWLHGTSSDHSWSAENLIAELRRVRSAMAKTG